MSLTTKQKQEVNRTLSRLSGEDRRRVRQAITETEGPSFGLQSVTVEVTADGNGDALSVAYPNGVTQANIVSASLKYAQSATTYIGSTPTLFLLGASSFSVDGSGVSANAGGKMFVTFLYDPNNNYSIF